MYNFKTTNNVWNAKDTIIVSRGLGISSALNKGNQASIIYTFKFNQYYYYSFSVLCYYYVIIIFSIQCCYRNCRTHARVFSRTFADGNSKNEISQRNNFVRYVFQYHTANNALYIIHFTTVSPRLISCTHDSVPIDQLRSADKNQGINLFIAQTIFRPTCLKE